MRSIKDIMGSKPNNNSPRASVGKADKKPKFKINNYKPSTSGIAKLLGR